MKYLIIFVSLDLTITTLLFAQHKIVKIGNFIIFICFFVETMPWIKRLSTHSLSIKYMYFYTTQQNTFQSINSIKSLIEQSK
jgi:hypothetical protein